MANLHTMRGSKQERENFPSHSLEARSPKSRCQQGWFPPQGSEGGCVPGTGCWSAVPAVPRLVAWPVPSQPLSSRGLLSLCPCPLCPLLSLGGHQLYQPRRPPPPWSSVTSSQLVTSA